MSILVDTIKSCSLGKRKMSLCSMLIETPTWLHLKRFSEYHAKVSFVCKQLKSSSYGISCLLMEVHPKVLIVGMSEGLGFSTQVSSCLKSPYYLHLPHTFPTLSNFSYLLTNMSSVGHGYSVKKTQYLPFLATLISNTEWLFTLGNVYKLVGFVLPAYKGFRTF